MRKTTLEKIAPNITSGSRGWASFYSDEGALFLRMTNLPKTGIGLLLHDNKYVKLPEGSSEGRRTRIQVNDILISITAELGKVGFINRDLGEAYVNQHVALVRIEDPKTHPKYLAQYLASQPERNRLNRLNDSGAKAGLSLRTINRFPVILPPLPEQKAIADLLTTWDKAIEKTERLIQAKEKQFKWLLRELISEPRNTQKNTEWKKVKLGEVCKLYQPQTISKDDMNDAGAYKVFGANGVIGFYDKYNHERSEIAITCRGATCGTLNKTEPKSWITGNAMIAQPNEELIQKNYLYYSLLRTNMKATISGAAQPQITRQDLAPLLILLPPLEEQQQIAETLSTAQQEINLLKQLAEKYKTQKRGLMQKMLTGEWRVKPEIVDQYVEKNHE
ncbi:MAG: restriction endonuclease subunit S [Candidatus Electrothrix sp. GM3_4]|nr:restriction endonuclease subunit S [Candidatus Electrothrix sp. GM3_4]